MASSPQRLPLRILYTINSSPQYILAKSPSAYPVDIIQTDPNQHGVAHIYASTALKHCLHTICRSSPELVQDNSRDFSVYVLDPLESNSAPAPVHISDSTSKTPDASDNIRGVAVGFGLMSWALRSEDETVKAVGTLVKSSGSESLEVVFALRETVSKTFPIWNAPTAGISHQISQLVNMMSLPDQNAVASSSSIGASFTQGNHPEQPYKPAYHASMLSQKTQRSSRSEPKSRARAKKPVPATGSDKLLDAPEVYIGPQKKKGRPKATRVNSNNELMMGKGKARADAIVIDDDNTTRPQAIPVTSLPPPLYDDNSRASSSQLTATSTQVQPVHIKHEPNDPNVFHIMKVLSDSASSPGNEAQKAVILSALNSIDSTESDPNSNPFLINALKQLVAMAMVPNSRLEVSSPRLDIPPNSHPPASQASQDDEIVVLDKENVNPIVFNKKRREGLDTKLQAAIGGHPSGTHSAPPTRNPSLNLRSRSNGTSTSPPQPLARSNGAVSNNAPRKRTLSDFMDERDNNRSRDKDRERSEKREPHRHSFLQPKPHADAYRHYRLDSELPASDNPLAYYRTALEPWTSPMRPPKDNNPDPYLADSEAKGPNPGMNRSPTRPQKAAASSPICGTSTGLGHSKKKYIVPAWARTDTATQPRLSEEAQQALKDAEERKRLERLENRRKSCSAQDRARRKRGQQESQAAVSSSTSSSASSRSPSSNPPEAPPPPTVRPFIAAANISPLAALFSSPRRRSPSPTGRFNLPQTPTRPKKSGLLTSGGLGDSLFTPKSRNCSIFGSARTPLFSPEMGYGVSGSPLNRKKMRTSLRTPLCSPQKRPIFDVRASASKTNAQEGEEGESVDTTLDKELDAAFEDLDAPPSSLPTASSDTEIDDIFSPSNECLFPISSQDQTTRDEDDSEREREQPQKEIWEGLPPSSPPPPSSPSLLPSDTNDEDMEDLELPVATSDVDTDFTDFDGGFSTSEEVNGGAGVGSQMYSGDEYNAALTENDFSTFFAMNQVSEQPMQSEDLFDQFTNINAQSDGTQQSSDQTINNMALGDIDFSVFWNAFNPIVEGNLLAPTSSPLLDSPVGNIGGQGFDFADSKTGVRFELDHNGLAQGMKDLFGGCVV